MRIKESKCNQCKTYTYLIKGLCTKHYQKQSHKLRKMKKELTVKEAGKKGGDTTFKKYGRERFVEISKKGVEARKIKLNKK